MSHGNDVSSSVSKVFLSHSILTCITTCTSKKRVLFGSHDVGCDSALDVTSLSLSVVAFVMVGSMWHSTSPFPHRYLLGTKDTLTGSCRSPPSFETPFVIGLGEGSPQKIRILQFFYRSVKVCTRCEGHSSIPHLWWPVNPCCLLLEKELFTFEKILPGRRGRSQCDKGIQDRGTSKIWVD